MVDLTEDQTRVLKYIDYFDAANPEDIRADLRCAFVELEILGLIQKHTEYRLTDAGRKVIPDPVGQTLERGK